MEDVDGTGFQLKLINPTKYDHSYWHMNRLQCDYTIIGNIYENPELLKGRYKMTKYFKRGINGFE